MYCWKDFSNRKQYLEDVNSLVSELAAPVKAFRVFALEKAIRSGESEELLKALSARLQFEDDDECLMLLRHAISSVEERLSRRKAPAKPVPEKISPAAFAKMPPEQQLDALRKTPTAVLKKDGGVATIKFLWQAACKPVVKAEIIRRCSSFWPAELADFLEIGLNDNSSVLQIACLEAIIARFPDRLQKNFDRLVMSADPIIRATAIRGLARKHPASAATFLSESLRKGDYYTRLAALRAMSIMPFNLNKSGIIELLGREKDERLQKIAAAIILSNPDREIPFRICDIIEKTPQSRHEFLVELQKNCCAMIRMAEICPDFNQFLATLKKYPKRIKARHFVQSCINAYDGADPETRRELFLLLQEKRQVREVAEAIDNMKASDSHELLKLVFETRQARPAAAEVKTTATPVVTSQPAQAEESPDLLKRLLRIRAVGDKGAREKISEAFAAGRAGTNLLPSAFRAAIACEDNRWGDRARQVLRSDSEDLIAAALEYLAAFDSESFMLQIRVFINSPSLIVRTALLRSLCRQSPENARELLASMLGDKDARVREKAISSLIHFEFASIRDLLPAFLERESNPEMLNACLSFYLTNPVMESTFDLTRLAALRPEMQGLFNKTCNMLKETLIEFNIASEEEISSYIERQTTAHAESEKNREEKLEKERLEKLAAKVKWNLSDSFSELSEYYPLLKRIFLGGMLLLALFFYLSGSEEDTVPEAAPGYTAVASQISEFRLSVRQFNSNDGSISAITQDNQKILALPRPGKAFIANPGDSIVIRAMPFRTLPDQTLVVKTIEVINSR
jgi:HEAT repeat protein